MATEKLIDFVAQDQIYKDYVRKEKDSVGKWVQTFDFMLSEESLVHFLNQIFLKHNFRKEQQGKLKLSRLEIRIFQR